MGYQYCSGAEGPQSTGETNATARDTCLQGTKKRIMTKVVDSQTVREIVGRIDTQELLEAISDGFVMYSNHDVVVPPVGHLALTDPPADVHIKYGYIEDDDFYVIKIASGFYENPKLGLSSSNGLMLVFNKNNGELLSVLLDEGHLTDIRTAIAGAIVAKHLAPKVIDAVGIIGTGVQARLQLKYLKSVLSFNKVFVWGRNEESLRRYVEDTRDLELDIIPTLNISDVTTKCNYIVTTTPSREILVRSEEVRGGTHITAVGPDAKGKHELDPLIIGKADIVIADSIEQCLDHGELAHGVAHNIDFKSKLKELGTFIKENLSRTSDDQITLADLTGVAVQDIQMAKLVYKKS